MYDGSSCFGLWFGMNIRILIVQQTGQMVRVKGIQILKWVWTPFIFTHRNHEEMLVCAKCQKKQNIFCMGLCI